MKRAVLIILFILIFIQFFQIDKQNKELNKALEIKAPDNIMTMLKDACYDCHSNQTKWPWYSNIAPFSWAINTHVKDGRKALNFSTWEEYSPEEKKKKMKELFRTVYASMPLSSYIRFHKEADLTREQRTQIRDWTGVKK